MKNMKFWRTALVATLVLTVMLSVTGGTIAWFTDSVTTANNVISAGTLDVELYHSTTDVAETKVDANTELFEVPTLWEPGAVAYENLKVTNEGTLHLYFDLSINATDANKITDTEYSLDDVLKVAVIEGKIESTDREEVLALAMNAESITTLDSVLVNNGSLAPKGQDNAAKEYGVIVFWAPSADDNNYNVNNGKTVTDFNGMEANALQVKLGVTLEATQVEYEEDSFGPDYDADAKATVYDVAGLKAALANGGEVILGNDIAVDETMIIPEGKTVTLDLNGKKISKSDEIGGIVVRNYGKLELTGEGIIEGTTGNYAVRTEPGTELIIGEGIVIDGGFGAVSCFGGTLTINGGDFSNEESNTTHYVVYATNNSTVVINDGTFTFGNDQYAGANGSPILAATNGSTIEIKGGTFDASTGSALCYNANNVVIKGGTFKNRAAVTYGGTVANKVADGYIGTEVDGVYVVSVDKTNVKTAEALVDAFAEGGDITITENISVDEYVEIPEGKVVTLNLNGKTISKSDDSSLIIRNYGQLTLSGTGTIDGTSKNYAVRTEPGSELTIGEGIVIDGGFGAVSCFGGKLTINGGDFSNEENNSTHYVVYATNNSTVVINAGTFTFGEDQYAGANGSPILAATNGSTIEINGGTFSATGGSALCYSGNNIVIKGGTFNNRATATYGGTIESKVAEGYTVTKTDNTWTVSVE